MPNPLCPDVPYDPGNAGIARTIVVQTVTIHRTIGRWAGDYSVGKNRDHDSGTFQFLIGQDDGQWVQFYPVDTFCSHAAGSNEVGPGIEITGQNGEPLTDWQIHALGIICRWLRDEWGIAPTFTDGDPRVWMDKAGPGGFVTHRHVAYPPAPKYHHSDYIEADEFARALGGTPAPAKPKPKVGQMHLYHNITDDTWAFWDSFNWTDPVDGALVWSLVANDSVPRSDIEAPALHALKVIVGESVEALVQRIAKAS